MVAMPCSSRSSQPRTELRSPALQADSLPAEPPGKPQLQASANSNGKTTPRYLVIQQNTFPSLPLLKLLRANPPHHIFMFKSFKASDCSLILLLENHKQRVLTENKIKKKTGMKHLNVTVCFFFVRFWVLVVPELEGEFPPITYLFKLKTWQPRDLTSSVLGGLRKKNVVSLGTEDVGWKEAIPELILFLKEKLVEKRWYLN